MPQIRVLLILLTLLCPLSSFSESEATSSPTVQIAGVVQSLSGNTLAVKPPQSPAVWVTIPQDLKVDRSRIKPGVEVFVEAHWAVVSYVASQVTFQK